VCDENSNNEIMYINIIININDNEILMCINDINNESNVMK